MVKMSLTDPPTMLNLFLIFISVIYFFYKVKFEAEYNNSRDDSYEVNRRIAQQNYDDFENESSPRNPCLSSTGVYLRVAGGNHGVHQPIGTPLMRNGQNYNGVTMYNGQSIAGDQDGWDLNHIMYPGDSISAAGIRVTLVKGGDNDVVRIEVVDKSLSEYQQPIMSAECLAKFVPISQSSSAH